ncbi:MAG: CsgG/HfaB family protein [Pseudomonadota bacterium]
MNIRFSKSLSIAGVCLAIAGCTTVPSQRLQQDEALVITGSAARRNYTPLEPSFACIAETMRERKMPQMAIAVGDVKDYTGKYSQNEGNAITQGGALMIYSALGKMGDTILLQERFDTRIAELELAYTDRRQLGDGKQHAVEAGKPAVPWVPYFGGTILRSSYYIVGGITELNYNIASHGTELGVSGVGVKRRTFTMNIGVDLRIVDTRTLIVARTVSLQKQIIGEEVGAGVYRFFGNDLLDINVGTKNQEPLQLGVRTTIEHGVIELVSAIAGLDPRPCLESPATARPAAVPVAAAGVPVAAPSAAARPGAALQIEEPTPGALVPQNSAAGGTNGTNLVPFDFTSGAIAVNSQSALERVAAQASQGKPVTFHLLARDNEMLPPTQRRELTNQRIKSVTDFLIAKGIAASRIGVTWVPSPTDGSITRHSAGFQLVSTMVVAP